jgi:hypothetical protein
MLHVTNGDSAVHAIEQATGSRHVLPWRDILHEGPTPAGLGLEQMSDIRARFLADCGFGKYKELRREFGLRDKALLEADGVTLWFDHDLYDQLQLIQILSAIPKTKATLICSDIYVGELDAEQMAKLRLLRSPVTESQFELARRAWDAFCAPDPSDLRKLVEEDTSALRFLGAALRRHLEEFPDETTGLGRSDSQILRAVADGARSFHEIFAATAQREEPRYMGDAPFKFYIDRLTNCRRPLLTEKPIQLTDTGVKVQSGELNYISLNGLDRWLGGVHLDRKPASVR